MATFFYFVLGGIGALLFAAIGAWLQHRYWIQQNFEKRREEQKTAASTVAYEVAKLLDRRLYRQRRFLWALLSGDDTAIEAARAEYDEILFEWNDNFGRIKAALWTSFVRDVMLQFESLNDRFSASGSELEAVYLGRLPKDPTLRQNEGFLRILGYDNYQFVHECLTDVRIDHVGDLQLFSHVSQENWNRLTSSFLLRRLFGLAQQR
ncbi:MAG: hypothetical protein FJX44_00500 [Alphaproteobacteria bacterium]|nr:hypothetical protein [Alphaproteobacteria bacterium]